MKDNRLCYCGSGKLYEKCCLFLDEIKKEYSHIKPHEERDEFHSFSSDIERYELTEAEDFFKRLIQSQPEHHDGFWGLARVYKKKGERDKMVYFYDQAIKRAKEFLKENAIDLEVIKMIESEKDEAIKS